MRFHTEQNYSKSLYPEQRASSRGPPSWLYQWQAVLRAAISSTSKRKNFGLPTMPIPGYCLRGKSNRWNETRIWSSTLSRFANQMWIVLCWSISHFLQLELNWNWQFFTPNLPRQMFPYRELFTFLTIFKIIIERKAYFTENMMTVRVKQFQ